MWRQQTLFESWYRDVEPRLRRALVAAYGPDRGREAAAAALAWAWEHRDEVTDLDQPVAYLYRVGQSRSRRRKLPRLSRSMAWRDPWVEPALSAGLRSLTEHQRVAVVLVHGYAWTLAEVGELLRVKTTTVQNHLDRGLKKLRSHLEVDTDA